MTDGGSDHIEFLGSFEALDDPRQQAKVLYPLPEILLLCLCAVLGGADSWVDVALYGQHKLGFLRRLLPFAHGVPSHDQLGNVFARLDAQQVADKSNEITAIPELLQLLELHGAVVTIDAMGCQRTIAAQIIDQKADYVFGLKGNQGTLHKDVALLFDERQDGFAGHAVTLHESFEKGHGRLETRRVVATDDLAWLQKDHQWPGMRSVAKVESRRELLVEGKVEEETRYYISSLPGDAKQIGHAVRSHWGVENGLHWVMDMVFRDDECRIRSAHAPANFATIKHMASNLLRRGKGKHSMRASRHIAGWDEDFLYSLLTT